MITTKRTIPNDFKENDIDKSYDEVFELICRNAKISNKHNRFVYFIDYEYVMDTTKGYRYENLTPAYDTVLHRGLSNLKYSEVHTKFEKSYNKVLDNLAIFSDRIVMYLEENPDTNKEKIKWFRNFKSQPAEHFEEAIQRMLFINQIFWQTDHRLVGMGAWDTFLYPFYLKDIEAGLLTQEEVLLIIEDLLKVLHADYEYKSNVLMGDTGQIFVLGRSDLDGNYICNDLTYLFIEAVKKVQQPEPKILLRVSSTMSHDLMELSLETILTGIGCPIFANDEVIIPKLIEFGIEPSDASEYTTSACWEPLIGGKSTSLNNMTALNYLKALDNLLKREPLNTINSFDELLDKYEIYLRRNLKAIRRVLEPYRFQYNPLLSVFTKGCFESGKDVSQGGALYHNVGITSVAMGNLVNSLLNIKDLVYDRKIYTLTDMRRIVVLNYEGYEELQKELKNRASRYATDDKEIIELVKRITKFVCNEISDYQNYLGGRMKVGLSGSAYRDVGMKFGASLDGRKAGEAFVVHISNEDVSSFTEVINFAGRMDYGHGMVNGNVVDIMTNPSFITDNWDKILKVLEIGIKSGFMELQMNVVSSETLIAAYNNPDKFPQLIVRVWGFSSYFNDLPDDYKKILIERSLKNEGKRA